MRLVCLTLIPFLLWFLFHFLLLMVHFLIQGIMFPALPVLSPLGLLSPDTLLSLLLPLLFLIFLIPNSTCSLTLVLLIAL